MREDVYIVDAKRTPVGKYGGSLVETTAIELGNIVVKALLHDNPKIKQDIDEVIFGNVLSAGLGQNPSRIVAFQSGISEDTPSFTINKVCGSGLKSITLAAQSIQNGDADVVLAGGMENMSRAPHLIEGYRFGVKMGDQAVRDEMIYDGLFCSLIGEPMGITAENIAKKYKISRKEQDAYSVASHKKALSAIKSALFDKEITPIPMKNKKGPKLFTTDEQPREDTNLGTLGRLSPAFKKGGSVTAGNSSPLNDAAAAVIVASASFVKQNHLQPMAKIHSFASVGLNPAYMGLGAYYGAKECLAKIGLEANNIDLWEINEAFASQSIAVIRLLEIDDKIVNVNGGAIALGHPIGASGARILTTLLYELKRRSKQYGMASLCIGGGQGIAMLVENV